MKDKSKEVQWRRTLALVASGTGRTLKRQGRAKSLAVLSLLAFCMLLVFRNDHGLTINDVESGMLVNDFGNNDRLLVPEYR